MASGEIRGPATAIIRSPGMARRAAGYAATTLRRSASPTPLPPTVTMTTRSSSWNPSSRRISSRRSSKGAGSKPVTYPANA